MVAPSGPLINPKMPKPQMGRLGPSKPKEAKQVGEAGSKEETVANIIMQSLKKEAPQIDAYKTAGYLGYMEKQGKVKIVKMHNTVFILQPKGNGNVDVHTATIEPLNTVVERWRVLPNTLKQLGYKHLTSYSEDPAIKKVAEQSGIPVKITQSQRMVGNKMVPTIQYDMDL
jgi:hypothetical protein